MKVRSSWSRSGGVRALAVLPLLALAAVGLSACDTKVGTAAVVDGAKISERDLNSYLTTNAQPVPGNNGSVPARYFALAILVNEKIGPELLSAAGATPSADQAAKARASVQANADSSDVKGQLTKLGFKPAFYDLYVSEQTSVALLQSKVTDSTALAAIVKKANIQVSVNPRYGGWDASTLSLTELSKKQLPDALTLGTALPGDAAAASASP